VPMGRAAHVSNAKSDDLSYVMHALFLVGSLLPITAMLTALFAAVWIRQADREREALAPRSHQH
jgi:hypothetical protein